MQLVMPEPQVVWHIPRTQNCPVGQTFPHDPQFDRSLLVSMHVSPPPVGPASASGAGHRTWSSPQRTRQRPSWQV